MEIYGTFYKQLETVEGENNGKAWRRGGFVIVTGEEIERFVAFEFRKEELFPLVHDLKQGTRVCVRFNPESREFEGKYYTSLRAYNILTNGNAI